VQLAEVRDLAQVADPAGVDDAGAHVVDQLLADQLLAVVDVLNTSPTASGVVVCCRISGTRPASPRDRVSIQNR